MAGNQVRKLVQSGTTFTAPAGCYMVTAESQRAQMNFQPKLPCVVDTNNQVWAWGQNGNGQLGQGGVVGVNVPTLVLGSVNVKAVSDFQNGGQSQSLTTMVLSQIGLAFAFGFNSTGNLGLGDVTVRSSPVAVLRGIPFVKVWTYDTNTFFMTDTGVLYACGTGSTNGTLGVGDNTPRSSPVAVVGGLTFASFAPAGDYCVGVTGAGVAYAWGANTNGNLGTGNVNNQSSPIAVLGSLTVKKALATSGDARISMFLTTAGTVYMCGINDKGQLGVGDVTPRSSPVAVLGGFTDVVEIGLDPAGNWAWLIRANGALYSWGQNSNGNLGVGDVASRSSPVAVLGLGTNKVVKAATTSSNPECTFLILTESGAAYACGRNAKGQVGDGTVVDKSSAVAVVGGFKFSDIWLVANVTNAKAAAYAFGTDGYLYGWGDNGGSQLGLGDNTARSSPVAIAVLPNLRPEIVRTVIPVVPGSTYSVTYNKFGATFGGTSIGKGFVDKVYLEYQN